MSEVEEKKGPAAHVMAKDLGVVWSAEHNQPIVYQLIDAEGGQRIQVRLLGHEDKMVPSAELKAAIAEDLKKRGLA